MKPTDAEIFMQKVAAAFIALALGACAGSQSHLRILEKENALSVQPAAEPGLYVVTIRNVKDFGFDPDDKPTRDKTALQALSTQCPAGRVVDETVINTGTYALGNPARTYNVRVKCSG